MIHFTKANPVIFAIANCGFITDHIAEKHFKFKKTDFNSISKENLVEKKGPYSLFGKGTTIYTLSDYGKEIVKQQGKDIYKSDITQLEHDYLLLKTYSTLPLDVQASWQNETELKKVYKQTSCDAIFTYNNKIVGVEIITPSYSKLKINESLKFISSYCDDSITMNTADIKL